MQQPIGGFHQDSEGHWVAERASRHAAELRAVWYRGARARGRNISPCQSV